MSSGSSTVDDRTDLSTSLTLRVRRPWCLSALPKPRVGTTQTFRLEKDEFVLEESSSTGSRVDDRTLGPSWYDPHTYGGDPFRDMLGMNSSHRDLSRSRLSSEDDGRLRESRPGERCRHGHDTFEIVRSLRVESSIVRLFIGGFGGMSNVRFRSRRRVDDFFELLQPSDLVLRVPTENFGPPGPQT